MSLNIPSSQAIEESVIGCIIYGKRGYISKLAEDDFFCQHTKLLFKALRWMDEQHKDIDIVTLADTVAKRLPNALDVCTNISFAVPTPEGIKAYISELKTYTARRAVLKNSIELQKKMLTEDYLCASDVKADALKAADIDIMQTEKRAHMLKDVVAEVLTDLETAVNSKGSESERLYTGFYDLDRYMAGLHKSELTLIAARPGQGKTTIAAQMAQNLARKGVKVLFVTREMSNKLIAHRIISNQASINSTRIRFPKALQDEDWKKLGAVMADFQMPIDIRDDLKTVQDVRAYIAETKPEVAFVDYIGLMYTTKKTQNRTQELGSISWDLKTMATEYDIPIVALSQLSRDNEKENREPKLSDLRDSGSLEQDANNVIFLHVPKDTDTTVLSFDTKVILAKQRQGPTGSLLLQYIPATFKFCNKAVKEA